MPSTSLSRAIEDVYRAFASESTPPRIDACPCCVAHEEICTLLNTPLRELSAQQLGGYAGSVFLTAGSQTDFRYFLPRILEVALTVKGWYPDLEIILGKLPLASWHLWPREQLDALNALFRAGFEAAIQDRGDPGGEIDTWICALSLARADLTGFLERLLRPDASRALVEFHDRNSYKVLMKGKLANAFWRDRTSESQAVVVWLKSPAVVAAVARARGV
jgi:hypothetical protein